jgi:phage-related protein
MKKIIWHPKARAAMREFPDEIKRELGYLIFRLQQGVHLTLPQSRTMSDVGSGVSELRVRGADGIYRAFYFLKSE